MKRLGDQVTELEGKIEFVEAEIEKKQLDEKLRQLGLDIRRLEVEREGVTTELNGMQKYAEARASLKAARSNLDKVQARIDDAYVQGFVTYTNYRQLTEALSLFSVKAHEPKFFELTGQHLDPTNMEDPLFTAAKSLESERDKASGKKAELVNQRNRYEGEIDNIKENIEKLELEASRKLCISCDDHNVSYH
jgi:chromosome segregation ATPase